MARTGDMTFVHSYPVRGEILATTVRDKQELAERLQGFIARSEKTQRQIAEEVGVDETYISKLTTGVTNWVASRKYFVPLARALNLSQEEIADLNPGMVFMVEGEKEAIREPAKKRHPRPARTARRVTGDMTIHEPPEGYMNELVYDKKTASWLVLTEAGGHYWIWFAENIPSGHKVLGSLLGWSIEALLAPPEPH